MYQFAKWKYWLVIFVLVAGILFALPNIFGEEPSLQLARRDRQPMDATSEQMARTLLTDKGVTPTAGYIEKNRLVLRFATEDHQKQAREALLAQQPAQFNVALSYASRMPEFMRKMRIFKPMSLGLDLRGGVHFVYEVDVKSALSQALERTEREFRTIFRNKNIPYTSVTSDVTTNSVRAVLRDGQSTQAALTELRKQNGELQYEEDDSGGTSAIVAKLTVEQVKTRQDQAIQQNVITMRKRVDALGIAEPIVARQGADRIMVELPGVQDPNEVIRILGATATLEFRLVDEANDPYEAQRSKRVPITSKLYKLRENQAPILLKRDV
ncbi:MAG TPA: hypothetical protein VK629_08990, partial [Steroidobacteraceae bacterium]|nr:hypothetical protein [Steroidobacteraceae bacterium]